MLSSTIALIILSAFLGLAAWLIFIWAVKKGQMDDIERPKYRMLDDDPPPAEKYREENKDV
jgi:cbb3-type cytochrome oxidase maturation protein